MSKEVEREMVVPAAPEEAWRAVTESGWLGRIDPNPGGEVAGSGRTGFVEEADAPRRLSFWWSAEGEEATRVEIELDETGSGTHIRVTESRPLAILDGRDLAIEFGGMSGGTGPMALAGALR